MERTVSVEVTSEDNDFPIESALLRQEKGRRWLHPSRLWRRSREATAPANSLPFPAHPFLSLRLFSLEPKQVHSRCCRERIGPLAIVAGEKYSAQYMEAIFTPGMTAPAHTHSGPEAWYTQAGETCLETSDGQVQIGGGWPTGDRRPRFVDASYCHRRGKATRAGPDSSRDSDAPNQAGPRLDTKGLCKSPDRK